MPVKTLLYRKKDHNKIQCNLCNHRCLISDGHRGICKVRENRGGDLKSLVYGRLIAKSIDPIEKKPFFHLAPGSLSYSIASVGCNFSCKFCQNSNIAQMPADNEGLIMGDITQASEVVEEAIYNKCHSIAYTYNEPTVFFEFVYDTAKLAHKKNIKNVLVSNGYMTPEAVELIAPFIDAANIDLKSYSDDFYKNYCGARLEPVKNTIKKMKDSGIFLEITTLLIPGLNDNMEEIEDMAKFIANEIGTETPWHLSRFHPSYKLQTISPTPAVTLLKARDLGIKHGLKYVYIGNVPGEAGEHTYCYHCSNLLIKRIAYTILENKLKNNRCPFCGSKIHGVDLQVGKNQE